jgi:hypothetical protein
VALAGGVGLVVWETFARGVAPLWLGHPLEASGLVEVALGVGGAAAQVIHVLTGLIAFPVGYISFVRPIARAVAPWLPWPVVGLGYGAGLWVFAMFVIAHLLAGMPAFLGFGAVAWASLIGHLALGLAIAGVVAMRSRPENSHAV